MTSDMQSGAAETEPWYRVPLVWLIIAIPSLTVVGCLITIYLALSRPEQLVSDVAVSSAVQEETIDAESQ